MPLHILPLHIQRPSLFLAKRTHFLRRLNHQTIAGKQHESPAAGLRQIPFNPFRQNFRILRLVRLRHGAGYNQPHLLPVIERASNLKLPNAFRPYAPRKITHIRISGPQRGGSQNGGTSGGKQAFPQNISHLHGSGANAHVPSIRTGTLRPIYVTFLRHVHQHLQGSLRLLHPGGHIRQFILRGCVFLLFLPLRFQFPDQFHQRLRKNILRPLRLKNADNLSGTSKPQVIPRILEKQAGGVHHVLNPLKQGRIVQRFQQPLVRARIVHPQQFIIQMRFRELDA